MHKIILFSFLCGCFISAQDGSLIITEVANNPTGGSTTIPGDLSHEFIEIFNAGINAIPLNLIYFKTESSTSSASPDSNDIVPWVGDSFVDIGRGQELRYPDEIGAGECAVILGRKYVSAPESTWYLFPHGATVVGTRKTYIRSGGMPNASTIIKLCVRGEGVVSTFNSLRLSSVDPGEGMSWHRVSIDSADLPYLWVRGAPSPGVITAFGSSSIGFGKLSISEFMAYPATNGSEWIEFLNGSSDTILLSGWRLISGGREGWLTVGSEIIAPKQFFCVVPSLTSSDPLLSGRLTQIVKCEAWGGLGNNGDAIYLKGPDGVVIDSVIYDESWNIKKGVSKEKRGNNWSDCCNEIGSTFGVEPALCMSNHIVNRVHVGNRRLRTGCGGADGKITLSFDKPFKGVAAIYNLAGTQCLLLHSEKNGAVRYLQWDGQNSKGLFVKPGVYFFEITSPEFNKKVSFSVVNGCR